MSKKELRKIARQIIKTNLILWQAIYELEDLYGSEIFKMGDEELEELAKLMMTYKNGTEQMAEPWTSGLYFQEFEWFGGKLQEYLDRYQD